MLFMDWSEIMAPAAAVHSVITYLKSDSQHKNKQILLLNH